jgi:hypothetical protein
MATIPIDCCVNDDHGTTTTRVSSVHFPGLGLDANHMVGAHFRELIGAIRISRRKFAANHLRSWVGNIYWERYGMTSEVAAACLHYLRDSKLFQPESGYDDLWRWWDSNIRDYALVARLLIQAAKDDRL